MKKRDIFMYLVGWVLFLVALSLAGVSFFLAAIESEEYTKPLLLIGGAWSANCVLMCLNKFWRIK